MSSSMTTAQRAERVALRREGEQYAQAGMMDRVRLVNEQLAALGEDPVGVVDKPARQKRASTQAATRSKRTAG